MRLKLIQIETFNLGVSAVTLDKFDRWIWGIKIVSIRLSTSQS